jgi:hypothetical protein
MKKKTSDDPLVGKFFFTLKDKTLEWQGTVVARVPRTNMYLVLTYEWLMGQPFDQLLVNLEAMMDWRFFDSEFEFRERVSEMLKRQDMREEEKQMVPPIERKSL